MIDIKDISSNASRFSTEANQGSVYKYTLMKEEYILLKFSVEKPVYFRIGDYVELPECLFEIVDLVFPTPNKTTGGYDYDLRLDAHYWKWKHKILFYDRQKGKEAKWSLTQTPDVHLSIVTSNLASLGYTYKGKPYVFSLDATVEMKAIFIQYDSTNIIDAITEIAKACNCEWWVKENYIFLGRCEDTMSSIVPLEIGNELSDMSRSDSTSAYATRVYAFGSDRNIPENYRPNSEDVIIEGVIQKRLKLPEGIPYIDAYPDMSEEEAIESVLFFDQIYPRRVGILSEVVETRGSVVDEADQPTGETYPIFTIKDAGLKNFKEEYKLDELRLIFQSGRLNGLDFELGLKMSDSSGTTFEILRNEAYGQYLPNDILKPSVGDTYVLYGYDISFVSDVLVEEAEQELLRETRKYVEKSKIDPSVFTCPTNPVRCAGYINGVYHYTDEIDLPVGRRVKLINPAFFQDGRLSRIYGFEKKLDNKFECTYFVGESTQYSRIGEIENRLDELKYNGNTYIPSGSGGSGIYIIKTNDTAPSTDQNVYSALMTDKKIQGAASQADKKYLRKDRADQTDFLVGLNAGATFGTYVGGFLGSGGKFDKDGYIEANGLTLREFLEVPELRFNRIDVVSGELWNSIAFGLIESVDIENQIVELKLEEGELSDLHVNDFCRGIFHNLTGNETSEGVDEAGFQVMPGFSTAYFTPVEIIDNARFKYELKPGTTVHPCPSMKFAVYGNAVEKSRQASAYSTRKYRRYLVNVDTWTIDPSRNISYQEGDLSNLVINGETLEGGSVYLNNVYFGGNILTVGGIDNPLKGEDAYSVTLTAYSAVYNVADGIYEEVDVVTRDKNVVTGSDLVVASEFTVSTRIQASKGSEPLYFSNVIGKGKYVVTSEGINCSYVITDGLVAVKEVTEDLAKIVIHVNCEGVAIYDVEFTIVRVKNGADGKDYEYVYTRTSDHVAPVAPSSEQINDYVPAGWTDDPLGPTLALPFEWVAKRVKREGIWGNYSEPSLWSRFGEDGTDYEYIYTRTQTETVPETPLTSQEDDYVPEGWTDDPAGPTSDIPFEWVCKRSKVDSTWGEYSVPALWSKYAEDGKDHEYIYQRTRTSSAPAKPATSQTDDYVPSGWTDDPSGVSATYPYEWISKRDKIKGVWGEFSTPSLWAKYGEDGKNGAQGPSGPQGPAGAQGPSGPQGPGLNFRGNYDSNQYYYYTNELRDVVKYGSFYYAVKNKGMVTPGWVVSEWIQMNSFKNIATGLLFAETATIAGWNFNNDFIWNNNRTCYLDGKDKSNSDTPIIALGPNAVTSGLGLNANAALKLFQSGTLTVGDGAADSNAGITGSGTSTSSIRFWAGSTFANRASAPFRVTQGGNLVATNASITGNITATTANFTGNVTVGNLKGWNVPGVIGILHIHNGPGVASPYIEYIYTSGKLMAIAFQHHPNGRNKILHNIGHTNYTVYVIGSARHTGNVPFQGTTSLVNISANEFTVYSVDTDNNNHNFGTNVTAVDIVILSTIVV